jgi:aminoglycoside phosphotransferase (APT) family kinase protein
VGLKGPSAPVGDYFRYLTRSLITFVVGERMDLALTSATAAATRQMAHSAGQALALIHQVRFPRAGFLDEHLHVAADLGPEFRCHTFLLRMLEQKLLRDNLGAALANQLRSFIDRNAALEEQMSFGGPILSHSDYKPSNLLVSDSRVAAVLDWEFAFAIAPLNDIGNFLRYSARQRPEYESAFIAGYLEAGASLPEDWRRLVRLVDLINLLDFLGRQDSSGVIAKDVRPLLEDTLREYA